MEANESGELMGHGRRSRAVGVFALLAMASGCAGTFDERMADPRTSSYVGAFDDELGRHMGDDTYAGAITLERQLVRYCLRRAINDLDSASAESATDSVMLASGLLSGGLGATLGAAAGAMDDSGTRTDVGQGGVILVSISAGLLALRAAFGLPERVRVRREAGARRQIAAARIEAAPTLEKKLDAFQQCVDEDIRVAAAVTNGKSTIEANAKLDQAKLTAEKGREAEKNATDDAVVAQLELERANAELAAATTPVEKVRAETKVADARVKLARAKVQSAQAGVLAAEAGALEAEAEEETKKAKAQDLQTADQQVNAIRDLVLLQGELAKLQAEMKVADARVALQDANIALGKAELDGGVAITGVQLTAAERDTVGDNLQHGEALKNSGTVRLAKAQSNRGIEDKKRSDVEERIRVTKSKIQTIQNGLAK